MDSRSIEKIKAREAEKLKQWKRDTELMMKVKIMEDHKVQSLKS